MKTQYRVLLGVGALGLATVLVGVGALAMAFMGNRAPVGGPLNDAARIVLEDYVSSAIVDTSAGAILIDCGADEEAKALKAALGDQPVAAIFLTHGHSDHVAGCHRFPGVPIYAMREEVDLIEGRAAPLGPLPRLMSVSPRPFQVTEALTDGQQVTIGDQTVTALHLPGHTAGSTAWLVAGVLFMGDSARAAEDGALRNAPWVFSDDVDENARSLQALAVRLAPRLGEVQHIAFSHTGPITGSAVLQTLANDPSSLQ